MRGADRIVRLLFPPDETAAYVTGIVKTRDGTVYHIDTRSFLEWSLWVYGGYELDLQATMRQWLRPGDVAIDVGANVGIHACALARVVGPHGRVIALEPVSTLAGRLRANCVLNDLRNVEVVEKAASSRTGTEVFFSAAPSEANQGQGSLYERTELVQVPQEVELETVDSIIEARGIARLRLVKIDVEGHELAVLRGMENALRCWRPYVVFEFNPVAYHAANLAWDEACDALKEIGGYKLHRHGAGGALEPLPRLAPDAPLMIAALPTQRGG